MHGVEQDLGRGPGRTWQDLVELSGIQWNIAEYSGERQIAIDCDNLVVGLLNY